MDDPCGDRARRRGNGAAVVGVPACFKRGQNQKWICAAVIGSDGGLSHTRRLKTLKPSFRAQEEKHFALEM